MSKLINNDNLNKLAKTLDARNKAQIESEKLRAEAKEQELYNKIQQLQDELERIREGVNNFEFPDINTYELEILTREDLNNVGGGSENYQCQYNEETEEITISGLSISYDEESENLQIGGSN